MQNLITRLYEIGVIKIGNFILKSGDSSPFYIDLRLVPSDPWAFKKVVNYYTQEIQKLPYLPDAVAGIMSAGIPFAAGIALALDIPLIQIRKEAKSHGTNKLIEGIVPTKGKVVLIDDLISTGVSKKDPILALRNANVIVKDMVVFLDRTNKVNQEFVTNLGVNLVSVIHIMEMLQILTKTNLDDSQKKLLTKAVEKWSDT